MSRHETIHDLVVPATNPGKPSPLSKIGVLLRFANAKDVTDFVRRLLARISDDKFADLVKMPRSALNEETLKKKTDSLSRMLRDQVSDGGLNSEFQAAIAEFSGFQLSADEGRVWRAGSAAEFEALLLSKKADGDESRQVASAPPTIDLDYQRLGASWSLIENLCSIVLFGNQDGTAELDFELSGQPTRVTICDETGRRILLQREIVVMHCIVELHLGGAEVQGGLSAVQRTVSSFLSRQDAQHLTIEVGGSARAPRLTVQVRDGSIGIARPLTGPRLDVLGAKPGACWLADVVPGTEVRALVRIYSANLQDYEPTSEALAGDGDGQDEPAIGRRGERSLAVDDRTRILMHLWKLAQATERGSNQREPGVVTLSYDARVFRERKNAN